MAVGVAAATDCAALPYAVYYRNDATVGDLRGADGLLVVRAFDENGDRLFVVSFEHVRPTVSGTGRGWSVARAIKSGNPAPRPNCNGPQTRGLIALTEAEANGRPSPLTGAAEWRADYVSWLRGLPEYPAPIFTPLIIGG